MLTSDEFLVLSIYYNIFFLTRHQVKLLESLETIDKDSFNMKFGGVLTFTTVS